MEKKIFLSESQLISTIKTIVESENDLMDAYDAFIKVYKQWIQDRFGLDPSKYPFSYLTKKYRVKFYEEVLEEKYEDPDDVPEIDRWNITKVVDKLLEKSLVSIPTLRGEEKFTETYGNVLKTIIGRLGLPEWVQMKFTENNPLDVKLTFVVDFPKMMSSTEGRLSTHGRAEEFKKYLQNYLGVEFGEPEHGELGFDYYSKPEFVGIDEWIKNTFNNKIKKEIKSLEFGKHVHSIKIEPKVDNLDIKIIYKGTAPWLGKRDYERSVEDYLESVGIAKNRIRVYH